MNAEAAGLQTCTVPERAIAVVGMSGRLPGAGSVAEYWDNLRGGVCSIRDFSTVELLADGGDPARLADPHFVPAKGFLDGADRFEAELFGFTPKEAAVLDPQHRLLLEAAWGALEDAGFDPRAVPARTGVYVGGGTSEHMIAAMADPDVGVDVGGLNVRLLTDKDFLASWISYRLGLDGPSMAVQTACSTSLTAVHVAVQALLLGECDVALAGGVAVDNLRREGYVHHTGGIMSRDGRCRPFSEDSDGTVQGNAVGIVALRRLEDAIAEGDPVHAVIRGSAAANDGSAKIGFTAPSADGQSTAMIEALCAADVEPETVGYIEMHGTATVLGDRIEVAATLRAYDRAPDRRAPSAHIGIGSVKGNIGHCDAAAGIAGLIKTVLMLEHGEFVPTVNVGRPNPALPLADTALRVVTSGAAWERLAGNVRRAGVSSVGLGGTNVHVIVEEAPSGTGRYGDVGPGRQPTGSTSGDGRRVLLPLSARNTDQLAVTAGRLADALDPSMPLASVAATLQHGRTPLSVRAVVSAAGLDDAVLALRSINGGLGHTPVTSADRGAPLFVFPGQASQYPGMGSGLYAAFPVFQAAMDRCAAILRDSHGIDPRSWLDPARTDVRGGTDYWQPTIVSVEYATTELLRSWAVEPAAMVGHSIGEYAAAVRSGVFSLEDALRLVAERGRLMAQTTPGRMVAVLTDAEDLADLLDETDWVAGAAGAQWVDVAAVNSPGSCVLSGPADAIDRVVSRLVERHISHRDLGIDHGFHSALMDEVVSEFGRIASRVRASAPLIPFASTVTGDWITASQATDPNYWADQIRRPVLFAKAIELAGNTEAGMVVEAGPGARLSGQVRRTLTGRSTVAMLDAASEEASALSALGALWSHGHAVDWSALTDPATPRLHLPGYAFAGTAFGALTLSRLVSWAPATTSEPTMSAGAPGVRTDPAEVETAAADSAEDRIAMLLRDTLGVAHPDDCELSYLAAGGESLTAVHIVGRLRDEFGIEAPIALLLEPIPLRELAGRIAAGAAVGTDSMLTSLLDELEAETAGASAIETSDRGLRHG